MDYLDRILILNILKRDRIFNRTVENRDRGLVFSDAKNCLL